MHYKLCLLQNRSDALGNIIFEQKYCIYRDSKAVSRVIFLLNSDPLAEVGVSGKHLVSIEPLHDVDGAIHAYAQQPSSHEENQDLEKQNPCKNLV